METDDSLFSTPQFVKHQCRNSEPSGILHRSDGNCEVQFCTELHLHSVTLYIIDIKRRTRHRALVTRAETRNVNFRNPAMAARWRSDLAVLFWHADRNPC